MISPVDPACLAVLSRRDTRELLASSEVSLRKYPELSDGVELHAPFVDWAGVKRPVINDRTKTADPRMCKVSINAGQGESQINLDVVEGLMGRPVHGLSGFVADSHFGDEEGKETFKRLSLRVAADGMACMLGNLLESDKPVGLKGITKKEMHVFGRAVFLGIGIHHSMVQTS